MNSIDLLFRFRRFNLPKVGPSINLCCSGDDLAAWLRDKWTERGVHRDPPGQEDCGWYLGVSHEVTYICWAATKCREILSKWCFNVDKSRSFGERLRARKITQDDSIVASIEEILSAEPDFRKRSSLVLRLIHRFRHFQIRAQGIGQLHLPRTPALRLE